MLHGVESHISFKKIMYRELVRSSVLLLYNKSYLLLLGTNFLQGFNHNAHLQNNKDMCII